MRVPFWVPRTPFGYAAAAAIGIGVFGLVIFGVFDGRPISEVACTTSACFRSRNLEAATALAIALVSGTWIGTRFESVWLRVQNDRGLTAARQTEVTSFGRSSHDVAALVDSIPFLAPEKVIALGMVPDSGEATLEATITAFRAAYLKGQALALDLYVQRAQVASRAKLVQSLGIAGDPMVQSVLRAVALLVVKDYLTWGEFMKAYGPYAAIVGNPKTPGPILWEAR